MADAVSAWEQNFGDLTEAEMAEADHVLDRAAQQRHRGVRSDGGTRRDRTMLTAARAEIERC